MHIHGSAEAPSGSFAITGNLINRNGAKADPDSPQSAHCLFEHVDGLVMTGNTLRSGVNDAGTSPRTPSFGIVCEGLRSSIIRDNVLHVGAVRELVVDRGGHDTQSIIRDNIGTLAETS